MAKALCLTGMIIAGFFVVLFALDLVFEIPFGPFPRKWILDISFILAGAGLGFMSWSAWREQE